MNADAVRTNEEWRDDPARRQAAAELHARWMVALAEVEQHLTNAILVLDAVPLDADDPVAKMLRVIREGVTATLLRAARIRHEPANDTRIGNMAAFGVGTERR